MVGALGPRKLPESALPDRLLCLFYDLRALNERLAKAFPGMTKLREDIGAILVMDSIKVTEKGVVEGADRLSATRVKQIYEEFARETSKKA